MAVTGTFFEYVIDYCANEGGKQETMMIAWKCMCVSNLFSYLENCVMENG